MHATNRLRPAPLRSGHTQGEAQPMICSGTPANPVWVRYARRARSVVRAPSGNASAPLTCIVDERDQSTLIPCGQKPALTQTQTPARHHQGPLPEPPPPPSSCTRQYAESRRSSPRRAPGGALLGCRQGLRVQPTYPLRAIRPEQSCLGTWVGHRRNRSSQRTEQQNNRTTEQRSDHGEIRATHLVCRMPAPALSMGCLARNSSRSA